MRTTIRQKIFLLLFGLVLTVVLLEAGLRLAGGVYTFFVEQANRRSLESKPTYRIICLGESTTVFGGENAYPRQLERILNSSNIGKKFCVLNKGVGATNTANIVALLENNLNTYRPDMVITMMGVNDGLGTPVCEDAEAVKAGLRWRGFKVYKLYGLLKEHILFKMKEIRESSERKKEKSAANANAGKVENQEAGPEEANIAVEKYLESAGTSYQQGKYRESEELYKKAIELNPRYDRAYALLGRFYEWRQRLPEGEEMCQKALQINPGNDLAAAELGCIYQSESWEKAEPMYARAFDLNPQNNFAFSQLVSRYLERGRFKDAEYLARKVIQVAPENDRAWGALALCCEGQGESNLAEELLKKANQLRSGYFNQATAQNYRKLKEMVTQRGIRLVCVQYPMREIEHLKKMLPDREGVIFVDNERIFQEAVRKDGYARYFVDNFGGDFGHGTPEGNRLLAQNVADTISREVFRASPAAGKGREIKEMASPGENLLRSEEAVLTAASESIPGGEVSHLIDNDPSSFWHVAPEKVGETTWVMVDFGEGRTVRSLTARPRTDNPRQLFRNAELLGSQDGRNWEIVARIDQDEVPRGDEECHWVFDNQNSFRYYKLLIRDGHADGDSHHFYSLAELGLYE